MECAIVTPDTEASDPFAVLVFRGTRGFKSWPSNLNSRQTPWPGGRMPDHLPTNHRQGTKRALKELPPGKRSEAAVKAGILDSALMVQSHAGLMP